jgi:hypothetical protein
MISLVILGLALVSKTALKKMAPHWRGSDGCGEKNNHPHQCGWTLGKMCQPV